MSELPFNPNDPLFLASRSLDERLTDDERRKLAKWLREDVEAARELEELRGADRLVQRWGRSFTDLTSDDVVDFVVAGISKETQVGEEGNLDQLLERFGLAKPEIHWSAFHHGVVGKIKKTSRQKNIYRWTYRISVPLAAAAVLAFAVLVNRDVTTGRKSGIEVAVVNPTVERGPASLKESVDEPVTSVVAFVRTRDEVAPTLGKQTTKGFVVIESSAVEQDFEDAPPI